MIKLIILDFDGTLGDTRANIVLTMRQTLKRLGYPELDEETIADYLASSMSFSELAEIYAQSF